MVPGFSLSGGRALITAEVSVAFVASVRMCVNPSVGVQALGFLSAALELAAVTVAAFNPSVNPSPLYSYSLSDVVITNSLH